eukprot:2475907-Ditylum_brightwellii.AAC.1
MANNKNGHDVNDVTTKANRKICSALLTQTDFSPERETPLLQQQTAETTATVISMIATMTQTQQSDKTQQNTLPEN